MYRYEYIFIIHITCYLTRRYYTYLTEYYLSIFNFKYIFIIYLPMYKNVYYIMFYCNKVKLLLSMCGNVFFSYTHIDIYFIQQRRYNMNYHCLLTNRLFLTLYTYFKCDALISSK